MGRTIRPNGSVYLNISWPIISKHWMWVLHQYLSLEQEKSWMWQLSMPLSEKESRIVEWCMNHRGIIEFRLAGYCLSALYSQSSKNRFRKIKAIESFICVNIWKNALFKFGQLPLSEWMFLSIIKLRCSSMFFGKTYLNSIFSKEESNKIIKHILISNVDIFHSK